MSFEFQSTLVNITPNHRIGGSQIGGARKEMIGTIPTIRISIVDDADIRFALSGPFEQGDPDAIYTTLSADLYEITPGLLINEGAVSSVEMDSTLITIDFAGSDAKYKFKPDATATLATEVASYTWEIPQVSFDALGTAAAAWRSSLDGTLEGLSVSIANEVADRIAADTAIQADVDQNEADADAAIAAEALERETNDNTIIASLANEASTREAADIALDGRLDVLEADPTTATAVAAGDAATLSSANTYTDGEIATEASARTSADASLSGRLDVLETDPTTATAVAAVQSDVDQNEIDSDAADAALSGRLDVLEADPTTATAVALKLDASAVSAYGLTLVDDADAATARTTLGLGTAATTAASDYATAAQGALADTAVQPAALDLKANKAGDTFTGDVIIDEGTGSTIKLESSDATSAGIHIEGPTGSMGYLDTTNGFGNDSLQVYSANFWVRAINGGTGNVIVDGNVTLPNSLTNAVDDAAAAAAGVAVGQLYRNGSVVMIRVA